jgi:ABC-type sugar transport system ATPase subunit
MTEDLKLKTEENKSQQEPLLEARNITKRFPGVLALNDISLKFMPGEVHAVVGENGAGKSTLMKIMAGAYTSDSGEILLQGKRVSFNHPREAQQKRREYHLPGI